MSIYNIEALVIVLVSVMLIIYSIKNYIHSRESSLAHVAAAKSGVESLTRTCAGEWAPLGIRVNAVGPGFISDTEGVKRFGELQDVSVDKSLKGTRQDMANAVLFPVSDSARFISGVSIRVDGGATIDLLRMPVV